jgi:hypothetical protein
MEISIRFVRRWHFSLQRIVARCTALERVDDGRLRKELAEARGVLFQRGREVDLVVGDNHCHYCWPRSVQRPGPAKHSCHVVVAFSRERNEPAIGEIGEIVKLDLHLFLVSGMRSQAGEQIEPSHIIPSWVRPKRGMIEFAASASLGVSPVAAYVASWPSIGTMVCCMM